MTAYEHWALLKDGTEILEQNLTLEESNQKHRLFIASGTEFHISGTFENNTNHDGARNHYLKK